MLFWNIQVSSTFPPLPIANTAKEIMFVCFFKFKLEMQNFNFVIHPK